MAGVRQGNAPLHSADFQPCDSPFQFQSVTAEVLKNVGATGSMQRQRRLAFELP
jgi:hypothetical protein